MTDWAVQMAGEEGKRPWWQPVARMLRIPPAVVLENPDAVAYAVREGAIAVLTAHAPGARVAPTTLPLLLTGPKDAAFPALSRSFLLWMRVVLAFGALLATLLAVQGGMLGPVSGIVGLTSIILAEALPNPVLGIVVRTWRYVFVLAALGLGLYGVTILALDMMIYLGEERWFGHPFRYPPEATSS